MQIIDKKGLISALKQCAVDGMCIPALFLHYKISASIPKVISDVSVN